MARIAIVGAGPAGSAAGWHLATRGHDVTLLDRAVFPRPKTCGDWITLGAVGELDRLGLTRSIIESSANERAAITHTAIVSPSGRRTVSPSREPAYCIPRLVFDNMLWRHAVDAGCRPMQRSVRSIGAGDGDFLREWPYLIDARGAHAGDANAVALRAYWTVPAGALSNAEASTVQIITDPVFTRGYGWIFPADTTRERVRFNIGVGMLSADTRTGHRVREFFDRFVEVNPSLRRWHNTAERERPVGCHVGLGLPRNAVGDAQVLRIGDAANLADPLTGDGIAHALKSGRLAAEAIHAATDANDALARWQRVYDATIQPELDRARTLQRWLTPTAAKNIAAVVLSAAAPLRRRVHRALFNEIPYGDLLR
jgi:flavin-dependent dehydrogenase